jgi:hypothetical protein
MRSPKVLLIKDMDIDKKLLFPIQEPKAKATSSKDVLNLLKISKFES